MCLTFRICTRPYECMGPCVAVLYLGSIWAGMYMCPNIRVCARPSSVRVPYGRRCRFFRSTPIVFLVHSHCCFWSLSLFCLVIFTVCFGSFHCFFCSLIFVHKASLETAPNRPKKVFIFCSSLCLSLILGRFGSHLGCHYWSLLAFQIDRSLQPSWASRHLRRPQATHGCPRHSQDRPRPFQGHTRRPKMPPRRLSSGAVLGWSWGDPGTILDRHSGCLGTVFGDLG